MSTVLITGCDYGIGVEFARQYAGNGWTVNAACLKEESQEKLTAFGNGVHFYQLDVSDEAVVKSFAVDIANEKIDILINNAAIFAPDGPGPLMLPDMDEFTRVMRVNAVAALYIAEALVYQVASSDRKLMIFIGTRSGSIGANGYGGHYAYRCSKAALNMAVKRISIEFAQRGIVAAVLHPGASQRKPEPAAPAFPWTRASRECGMLSTV